MDAREKRNRAEAVRRRFSRDLSRFGFHRTKTSFWTRERELVVDFIHLHLFSYVPAFRVHLGIRVLNDSFVAPALNGPSTADGWFGDRPRYLLEFSDSQGSIDRCAENLLRHFNSVAMPWFDRFIDPRILVAAVDSPLRDDDRTALADALAGRSVETHVAASRAILGLAKVR